MKGIGRLKVHPYGVFNGVLFEVQVADGVIDVSIIWRLGNKLLPFINSVVDLSLAVYLWAFCRMVLLLIAKGLDLRII
jgi:hypothetical protein